MPSSRQILRAMHFSGHLPADSHTASQSWIADDSAGATISLIGASARRRAASMVPSAHSTTANTARRGAGEGGPLAPFRGLTMGLVCADPGADAAMLFREAAQGLGAQVTVLDPAKVADGAASLKDVARLLGRLYGAIECQGLPPAWVRRLADATAVPVFDGLAEASPAQGPLPEASGDTEHDRRVRAVQAALLAALR